MTEKQSLKLSKDFMAWWENEGSAVMNKDEMHLMDNEEFIFERCKTAWFNAIYKFEEKVKDESIN